MVTYGPYKRKGKMHAGYTTRGCTCTSNPTLCPHLWVKVLNEININSAEKMSLAEFNTKLQESVNTVLPPAMVGYIRDWTSHAFRRGSSVDILQAGKVNAMMKHGEWSTETSAHSYATLDEISTQRLRASCVSMVDLSDDD